MRRSGRLTALLLALGLLLTLLPWQGYALEAEPEEMTAVEAEEILPETEESEPEETEGGDIPAMEEALTEPEQTEPEVSRDPEAAETVLTIETTVEPPRKDALPGADTPEQRNTRRAALALSEELTYHTSLQALAEELREHMRRREESFQVGYCAQEMLISGSTATQQGIALKKRITALFEAHTGVATEGDYLKWQNDGFKVSLTVDRLEGLYYHTITITPYHARLWYTTAAQEAQVDEGIAALRQRLFSEGMSDGEKIRAAYDYITQNVAYDHNYAQRERQGDYRPFTCYGALMEGKAVCQGYALLFYRLMLEEGIDCRVISGYDGTYTYHAWNIVRLGDVYWNVDATWDAGETDYQYYLRCEECFTGHTRDHDEGRNSVYDDEAFYAAYPMGVEDLPLSAPVITGAEGSTAGLRLRWSGQKGAERYRIWQWTGTEWTSLTTTGGTEVMLPGISEGEDYTLAVSCAGTSGEQLSHRSAPVSGSYDLLPAPELQAAVEAGGVRLRWSGGSSTNPLRIFRFEGGELTRVGDTTGTSLLVTGLTSGKTYTFCAQYLTPDRAYAAGPRGAGSAVRFLSAPVLTDTHADNQGVVLRWNAVQGAVNYRIFYQSAGKWVPAGNTTKTSFTIKGLKTGTSTRFTVRCISADGKVYTSGYLADNPLFTYVATPSIQGVSCVTGGVQVRWKAVNSDVGYRVFYRTSGGSWVRAGDTKGTSLRVSGLKSGTRYDFTLRCVGADGRYASGYRSAGTTLTYLEAPVLTDTHADNQGVVLRWKAVQGAVNYRIFYQSAGKWISAGTSKKTTFTVKGIKTGTSYRFTVRCISADGKAYTSGYRADNPLFTYAAVPSIQSANSVTGGVQVRWKAASGAVRYRVYYRTQGGSWVRAGDTTGTSFTVKNLTRGRAFRFTVRCVSADGKAYTSGYHNAGMTARAK